MFNMVIYLLFLYLLFVNFWEIKPIGYFSEDVQLILIVSYLLFGCFIYRKRPRIRMKGKYNYLKWIFIGILLSMISAYIFYGQPITQSIITYRTQYLIFTIPALFVISPRIEDIIRSLFIFSFFLLGANLLVKLNHNLFVMSEYKLDYIAKVGNYDSLTRVAGIEYITIPLFYYLQRIKEKFTAETFVKVLFLLFVVFIVQNRSTLFPAILFSLYTFIFIKSKYKPLIWIAISIIGVVFIIHYHDVFATIFEETTEELGDQDYNRNKAWNYFIYMYSPHWLCYILGNGFLSAHYSPIMQLLMEEGIYNSDVGFIGYWNQFGVIPVITIFTMYLSVLKGKNSYPFLMKLIVIYSIICGLTTIYYGQDVKILHLALFYYLFYYFKKNKPKVSKI